MPQHVNTGASFGAPRPPLVRAMFSTKPSLVYRPHGPEDTHKRRVRHLWQARGCLWMSTRKPQRVQINLLKLWHRVLCHRHPADDGNSWSPDGNDECRNPNDERMTNDQCPKSERFAFERIPERVGYASAYRKRSKHCPMLSDMLKHNLHRLGSTVDSHSLVDGAHPTELDSLTRRTKAKIDAGFAVSL